MKIFNLHFLSSTLGKGIEVVCAANEMSAHADKLILVLNLKVIAHNINSIMLTI